MKIDLTNLTGSHGHCTLSSEVIWHSMLNGWYFLSYSVKFKTRFQN
jgi:hypothetical protein